MVSAIVDTEDPIMTPQGGAAAEVPKLVAFVSQKTGLSEAAVLAALQKNFPHTTALLEDDPALVRHRRGGPACSASSRRRWKLDQVDLLGALTTSFPALAQAITNLPAVTNGWNNVPNTDGATLFDGKPIKTVPDVRTYFGSDVIPVLENQRGNYEQLMASSSIFFIGPLVLIVGIIVIIYGLLMLLLARRLEPGTSKATGLTAATGKCGRERLMIASSTGWQIGIALGIVVIAVAAVIVIAIVLLAIRIARQAETAVRAVEVVRRQTDELGGIARINDSGVRILHAARALRKVAVGQMTLTLAIIRAHGYWAIALVHRPGRGARSSRSCSPCSSRPSASIETLGRRPARDRDARSPRTRPTSRSSRRRRRCSALIVDEAVVQDGYMNALTDGFGASMSTTHVLVLLSVVLAVVVVARAGRRADRGAPGPDADLRRARDARPARCEGVESEHLRPLEGAVTAINAPVRHHPRRAARDRPQGRRSSPRGGRDDPLVDRRRSSCCSWSLPVVVYLLHGVLAAATEHRPERADDRRGRGRRVEGSRRRARCC